MSEKSRKSDIAFGGFFVAFGFAWIAGVVRTIPPGTGGGDIGPRAFPLMLGILLVLLSAGWVIGRIVSPTEEAGTAEILPPGHRRQTVVNVSLTLGMLLLYGWLMTQVGFTIATFCTILLTVLVILRDRRPLVVIGMALGVTFAIWLIFEAILGIPLANGRWLNLG
ncbi:MAG: tripartite tricarboxylate transporter TctB family protein [Paracoccaceae bacterium]|nr:tripartite tricarboxylate transporter TctB family protein [Paracoccaceae bacterium]